MWNLRTQVSQVAPHPEQNGLRKLQARYDISMISSYSIIEQLLDWLKAHTTIQSDRGYISLPCFYYEYQGGKTETIVINGIFSYNNIGRCLCRTLSV